jgi:polyisoprenoid-binding protein YceI
MKPFKVLGLATVLATAVVTSGPVFAADAGGDEIVVLAKHAPDPKPDDPVQLRFERFKVTKASFDPKKIEGGAATIEIDTTSLKSGSDKRDAHLQTPDYIDAKKYATITVDIANVKKKAGKTYTADATVKFRDVTKKYPVTFDVVDAQADWIKIKSETTFSRLDFKLGGTDPKTTPVQPDLTIKMALTLKKT